MKKKCVLLLVLILSIAGITACSKSDINNSQPSSAEETLQADEGSLRILIDFPSWPPHTEATRDRNLKDFKNKIIKAGGPRDIIFDCIYFDYNNGSNGPNYALRDNDLTRVRTEIMAGNGPDVFITVCEPDYEDPVFKYPDQVMSRRTFLPLDEYIEKAQFMEWDKLTPVIMEAGKGEEGQLALPLTYSMPLTVFRKAELEHEPSGTLTFFDIAESDNPVSLFSSELTTEYGRYLMDADRLASVFPALADYDTETLAFSEEDLKEVIKILGDLEDCKANYDSENMPSYYHSDLKVEFNFSTDDDDMYKAMFAGIDKKEHLTFFPLYSTQGGYCATITSFAAINRNTKRPDDAFFVLDYLLSLDCQCSPLYANLTYNQAIPTHEEAMQKRTQVVKYGDYGTNGWQKWYLAKSNFDELCNLRDNVSYARFRTELDEKLVDLFDKSKYLAENESALDREVHRAYMEMSMMLGES